MDNISTTNEVCIHCGAEIRKALHPPIGYEHLNGLVFCTDEVKTLAEPTTRIPYTPGARQAKAEIPTDEQRVKAFYHDARYGRVGEGPMVVMDGVSRGWGFHPLGTGDTEAEAWKDAASKLPASLPAEGPKGRAIPDLAGNLRSQLSTHPQQGRVSVEQFESDMNSVTLPAEGVALPPLRMTKEGTPVHFFPSMNPERRAKLKAQWTRMDEQDCRLEHYKPYEWNLRNAIEQLEVREEQFLAALSESAALRKQRDEFEQKGKDLCVALGSLGIHIHELGLRMLPGSKMGEWKYYNERAETAEAKLKEAV